MNMTDSEAAKRRRGITAHPFMTTPVAPAMVPSVPDSLPDLSPNQATQTNEPLVLLSARVPQSIHRGLKLRSALGWGSIQELVIQAVSEYLSAHPLPQQYE